MLKKLKDVNRIIEDGISEMLNLASVDPNEIVAFQDRQDKLKISNVLPDYILVKPHDSIENAKLKPGVIVWTVTNKLTSLNDKYSSRIESLKNLRNEYSDHIIKFDQDALIVEKNYKPLFEFLVNPPVPTPKLT